MASCPLPEHAKHIEHELFQGFIEHIILTNRFFLAMPFDTIEGNAVGYNRELSEGGYERTCGLLETFLGEAEIGKRLAEAEEKGKAVDETDVTAALFSQKAKHIGRLFLMSLSNGLSEVCSEYQKVYTGPNGTNLSIDILNSLLDMVTDRDGMVDYIMMPGRTLQAYKNLIKKGGTEPQTILISDDFRVPAYMGIPIFKNDYLPTDQRRGRTEDTTTIYAGTFDDGSRSHGLSGLTTSLQLGLNVLEVGEADSEDFFMRLKWYAGFALFSEKGLACADGIID